jgi:endonuclease YncB( thermonuclease family)
MTSDLVINRLAGTFILCLLATPALADVTGPARVIDGDTLEVQGQRIRLHGIDARMSLVGGKADIDFRRLDVSL